MNNRQDDARRLLRGFKGSDFLFGLNCFDALGGLARPLGRRAMVIAGGVGKVWGLPIHDRVRSILPDAGLEILGDIVQGAGPNSPKTDVIRVADEIKARDPDVIVTVGGGSVIDAAKASIVLAVLGDIDPDLESYYGVGILSDMLEKHGRQMIPMVAVQLAAGSGAHLTKYSNITDMSTYQKKLIIDEAVTPPRALFDYAMTTTMSKDFTADGALDGVAHALEVFYGSKGDALETVRPVSTLAIELIVDNIKLACDEPDNLKAREALGLGTDLGGYAIMIGGTNGPHLTSFSLVDVLVHGRACALLHPYYAVFFAPAIPDQLRTVGAIFKEAGYSNTDFEALSGRDLGLAVAEAMIALSTDIGFPTRFADVEGFTDEHIARALAGAKNPQLESKLKNMPVPLTAEMVDDYMGPVLEAAKTGDFSVIKNLV